MNSKALKTLEYNRIIDMLVQMCDSDPGKEIAKSLMPFDNVEEMTSELRETSDALTHILTQGAVSFGGVTDIRPALAELKVGAVLSASELIRLASILSKAGTVKTYFDKSITDGEESTGDSLDQYYQSLMPVPSVMKEINRALPAPDEVADDASRELFDIRRKKKSKADEIHASLSRIISSHGKMLQDSVIAMRDDRYCLPVKQEYRSQFPGMVHDQSASGATVFIEPQAVVDLNNEIKLLEGKEKEEIERILARLSEMCAGCESALTSDFKTLKRLDFIFAKGKLSRAMKGSQPLFATKEEGVVNLKKARHPLISKDKVVPVDITIGGDYNMLVVTGPNTGGKTVSLKTVGLLTLMGESGLHIPAFDGSTLIPFKEIYADIGDEQSIEQSLSTFSAHMVNIVSILKKADNDSFVLFDELGAGTDPVEGAGLAQAILESLHEKGIFVMATTHYSELKIFALKTDGVENASCEFDLKTLSPTYKLIIGIPGKSNAFAISKKLGLSDDIIDRASENIANDEKNFEDVVSELEKTRNRLEHERELTAEKRRQAGFRLKELREEKERIEASKSKILDNANRQAAEILSDAKDTADETIRKFMKAGRQASLSDLEAERRKVGSALKKRSSKIAGPYVTSADKHKPVDPEKLLVGSPVKVLSMGVEGTVSTLPDRKGNLKVTMGILTSDVNIKDIELITRKDKQDLVINGTRSNTGAGRIKHDKASSVHSELNIIGMTVDEAMPVLDKYMDDAYIAGLSTVRIIHGRGTGALRHAVAEHLNALNYVKDYRSGEAGEGDIGVTIVFLK
ncbi:MAG: endonuclease MutS2 [Lachnospiraceae bacterium]|nr:endonuclease MutS2 [Lachnospiraceae bacterium]MEE3460833.1 endonuclease MutS2 [Lachnospiraceae bacterium]